GSKFSSAVTWTRQSAHIFTTSKRVLESLYIQCLPSSLAATRSTELLTPNGVPQRMQRNGSSCLMTRLEAGAAGKARHGLMPLSFFRTVSFHHAPCPQA